MNRKNVSRLRDTKGQAIVEYALVTAVIGLGVVAVYYWFSQALEELFWNIVGFWARQGP